MKACIWIAIVLTNLLSVPAFAQSTPAGSTHSAYTGTGWRPIQPAEDFSEFKPELAPINQPSNPSSVTMQAPIEYPSVAGQNNIKQKHLNAPQNQTQYRLTPNNQGTYYPYTEQQTYSKSPSPYGYPENSTFYDYNNGGYYTDYGRQNYAPPPYEAYGQGHYAPSPYQAYGQGYYPPSPYEANEQGYYTPSPYQTYGQDYYPPSPYGANEQGYYTPSPYQAYGQGYYTPPLPAYDSEYKYPPFMGTQPSQEELNTYWPNSPNQPNRQLRPEAHRPTENYPFINGEPARFRPWQAPEAVSGHQLE